jgi:hypothetical protein
LAEENFASAIFEQKKPVIILWGSKDLVAPPRTGQLLTANLASNSLTIIDGAGHVPMASHPQEVSRWLLANLNTAPNSILKPDTKNTTTKQNYSCDHSTGDTLRGHYARITLTECTSVLLDGVVADELILNDSVIEIQHSHFLGKHTSLAVTKSVVMMTGGSIAGLVKLDQARIDFAGVNLSKEIPFTIIAKSRLVLSVSRAGNNRYLHNDLQLESTNY